MNDQEFLEMMREANREAGLPAPEDLEDGPLFEADEEFES